VIAIHAGGADDDGSLVFELEFHCVVLRLIARVDGDHK
jgi:hypothetical protein